MGTALHPVFTRADLARMSINDLAFFTDAPVAHAVAFRDFQRSARIEAENKLTINLTGAR